MIGWPDSLVDDIVGNRCVFFLGAGVSAGSKTAEGKPPPTWTEFLNQAVDLINDDTTKKLTQRLISDGQYLIALQSIKDHSIPGTYSALLNSAFHAKYKHNRLHEIIYNLDSRIVITTNFDKIYENYCNSFEGSTFAYKVITYRQEDFADEIRSDTRLIVKSHGTIDAISEMIFTRAEYHQAKVKYRGFYEVLKAVFLTNTVVFIGCGFDDPDLLLLLEEVKIFGRSQKTHFALMKKGDKNPLLIDAWKHNFNTHVFEYGPEHSNLIEDMQSLLDLVQVKRAQVSGFNV